MTGSKNAPDRDPERLVRDYADLVLRVCYTYLRSTADAEDVCQDTLVKLLLHEEPFRDPRARARVGHPRGDKRLQEPVAGLRRAPRGGTSPPCRSPQAAGGTG